MGDMMIALAAYACAATLVGGCGEAARPALTQRAEAPRPDLDVVPDGAPDDGDANTEPECSDNDQCTTARACRRGRCVRGACVFDFEDDGTRCDDGDPCTPVDRCSTGECRGAGALDCGDDDPCTDDRCRAGVGCEHGALACDDGDACTSDACRAGTGCVATPIACAPSDDPCFVVRCDAAVGCVADAIPGCAGDAACDGVAAGGACDDGDADTHADLCLGARCRGFRLVRVPGETLGDDVSVHEVDHDGVGGDWSVALSATTALGVTTWALADLDDTGVTVHAETIQAAAFHGLDGGFAGDDAGRLWQWGDDAWSADNAWDVALGVSGRAAIRTLAAVSGETGARFAWLAGGDDWARVCKADGPGLACVAQSLGGAGTPVALAAVGLCDDPGGADGAAVCRGASLALGVDRLLGGGFNTTSVLTQANGLGTAWNAVFVPAAPAFRATRAAVGWRDGAGSSFAVVGERGYLVLGIAGAWQGPLVVHDGQAARDFVGVTTTDGVVLVAAHRAVGLGQTAFELWVAPLDDLGGPANGWVLHELGRFDGELGDGLADVDARDGSVRVVGAVRRDGLLGGLDGAVWKRDE